MKLKAFAILAAALLFPAQVLAVSDPVYIGPPIKQPAMEIVNLAKSLNGSVGNYFSAHFSVNGGTAPYTWNVSTLPAGLYRSLLPSAITACAHPIDDVLVTDNAGQTYGCPPPYTSGEDLIISGTPTVAGNFPVTFTVTDTSGIKATQSFTFGISSSTETAPAGITILTDDRSHAAAVGKYFITTFSARGGIGPYAWKVSGQLPPGLGRSYAQFNCIAAPCNPPMDLQDSLYISGTPTKEGTYTYAVYVTDSAGKSTSQSYTTVVSGSGSTDRGITVTSPKAGDAWTLGQQYAIAWVNTTGISRAINVNITLNAPRPACLDANPRCLIAEMAPYVIANNISDSGSYAWIVPKDLPAAYQGAKHITVASVSNSLYGTSGQFTIGKEDTGSGPITVTSPLGGAQWTVGKIHTISWSYSDDLPVKILLQPQYNCSSGLYCPAVMPKALLISDKVYGASFSWTIPATLEGQKLDGKYQINIETSAIGVDYVDGRNGTLSVSGQSGVFSINTSTVQPPPRKGPAPASVVRTPDKAVHLILDGGAYYTFRSWDDFLAKGYVFQHIRAVAQNALEGLTQTSLFERPSGTTFKYPNDRTVYYLTTAKCKQAYTSFGVFQAWRLRLVDIVLMQPSEQFPTCSDSKVRLPNGAAVKVNGRTVYFLENDQLRPVANGAAFKRLGSPEVFLVGDSDFAAYAQGDIIK